MGPQYISQHQAAAQPLSEETLHSLPAKNKKPTRTFMTPLHIVVNKEGRLTRLSCLTSTTVSGLALLLVCSATGLLLVVGVVRK